MRIASISSTHGRLAQRCSVESRLKGLGIGVGDVAERCFAAAALLSSSPVAASPGRARRAPKRERKSVCQSREAEVVREVEGLMGSSTC